MRLKKLKNRRNTVTEEKKATKDCPNCGEEILEKAIKCKHCKSDLTAPVNNNQDVIEYQKQILKSCEDEYNHLYQTFQSLDSKANTTAGISGILIAAAFAFTDQFRAKTSILGNIPFIVLILILLISLFFSLRSMWVQYIDSPLSHKGPLRAFNDISNSVGRENIPGKLVDLYGTLIGYWPACIETLKDVLNKKVKHLSCAQHFLGVALALIALLNLLQLLKIIK
jgi:hypothetical protein